MKLYSRCRVFVCLLSVLAYLSVSLILPASVEPAGAPVGAITYPGSIAAASVTSVGVFPTTIVGGKVALGEVFLSAPAPAGGAVVNLTSSSRFATVPRTVTVYEREISATFNIKTKQVSSQRTETISATYGVTVSVSLTITPKAAALSSVRVDPATVVGGNSAQGTANLTAAAPTGGVVVTLSSDNPSVASVPASVTVPEGASSANFPVTTSQVVSSILDTISATYVATASTSLTVVPVSTALSSVSVNPTTVVGGTSSQGTASLTGAAPAGGAVVSLASNNPSVASVPAGVTVPAGSTSASFSVTTSTVASDTSAMITGSYGGATSGASLTVQPAATGQFYVAPNGSSSGNGSASSPWNLQTALNHPSSVHPGDTIWVRGGTYVGIFTSSLTGTATAPIVVRAYPGERATIDGRTTTGNILTISGSYTWYWGLEVTNSNAAPNDIAGIVLAGGTGVRVINCISHDHGGNGIQAFEQNASAEFYGNLSYFNGRQTLDANHAYGIYMHNQVGERLVEENFLLHNFGNYPMHIYGSAQAYLDNFRFVGNIAASTSGGNWNLIGGGRVAQNPVFTSNFFYGTGPDAGVFDLGWQDAWGSGTNNATVTGNYVLNGKFHINGRNTGTVMTGNTIYGRLDNFTTSAYPNNTYYVSTWPAAPPRPTGIQVFVRPNRYEPGRANIIVLNWDTSTSASVDLSSVLIGGDRFEIRDAQNFFGAPVLTGTYAGGAVTLPLNNTAIATPVSVPSDRATPVHTNREFCIFVVLKVN